MRKNLEIFFEMIKNSWKFFNIQSSPNDDENCLTNYIVREEKL